MMRRLRHARLDVDIAGSTRIELYDFEDNLIRA
jgi:hypothetical protein